MARRSSEALGGVDSIPLEPTEAAILAVAVVIVFLVWKRLFGAGRVPKQKHFRCARCSKTEAYSTRTIQAWREGKTRLFCRSCHIEWLKSQPASRQSNRSARSGCLGALVIGVAIPMVSMLTLFYAYHAA
jgi:hypothetical protein